MTWIVIGLIVALVVTAKQSRRYAQMTDRRRCTHCGAIFAADAKFCGRCGRKL